MSGTILCNIVKTNIRGSKISSSIPSENSIQEPQSIIAQAAARGLQLSADGRSWVPINSESRSLPLEQSNEVIVKTLPSDICPEDHNVRIVKIGKELTNFQAIVVVIYSLMGVLVVGGVYLLIMVVKTVSNLLMGF